MDDMIYRQAAISLPVKPKEDRYFQTQNLDDAFDYGWYSLQGCIEKLPPAQPQVIFCKDCRYYDCNRCELHDYRHFNENDFCSYAKMI